MKKQQKKKFNKQHKPDKPRRSNPTKRDRLSTMVIPDKKKVANKKKCRGKVNTDDS